MRGVPQGNAVGPLKIISMWVQDKNVLLKNVEERMTSRVEVMEEMGAEGFSWVIFF